MIKRADTYGKFLKKKTIDEFLLDLQKYSNGTLKTITEFVNLNRWNLSADEVK